MYRIARLLVSVSALLIPSLALAASDLQPDLSRLDLVPHYHVAGAAAAQALVQQWRPQRSSQPPRIAAGVELPLQLADGRWQRLDSETWSWRVRVGSPGAKLLNFRFSQFHLPPSGRLYIYDAQGRLVQGPYTSANHTPEGMLWTALVEGEEAVIELRVADAERYQVRLALGTVFHGIISLSEAGTRAGLGGSAGSCEVNVACPAGANWPNEIRSVAVYTAQDNSNPLAPSEFICSGDLVNNVRGDNTPYFLTAHHCQVGWNGNVPASSMVVYWNYQADSCTGTTGSLSDSQSGATFDATDAESDFNLLTLGTIPSSYNVHYAGFDASGAAPASGVGIHHPLGDIKKISTYNSPASAQDVSVCVNNVAGVCTQNQTIHGWLVSWAQGVTEEGSSGSALWDQNHRVVGVLTGGSSACGSSSGPDVYGRLDAAWTAAGTGGSLAHWLDPDNTGARVVDGRDPGDSNQTPLPTTSGGSGGGGGSAAALLGLLPLALLRRRRAA
ncbi:MAG: trypsin-like peptidase domain-containing protein [Nevskia sp.]|nr:trypsin-like peptidase domain-containing protein [Nevskia sp.]